MSRFIPFTGPPRGVHWSISAALVVVGLIMVVALTVQSFSGQHLITHRYWVDMLHTVSAGHATHVRAGRLASLPTSGLIRAWYVEPGQPAPHVPAHLARLAPGLYSTEGGDGTFESSAGFRGHGLFHTLVADLPPGRLVTVIDIKALEDQQNHDAWFTAFWAGVLAVLIGAVITWLHANLVRPVRDLADRMRRIDPGDTGARLPTTYAREEIQIIAQASNAYLERVERFIERERSLLDQASHEFRTPIAVIAGAVDVLHQIALPEASKPALGRIEHAVADLSETMVALLYLARESERIDLPADVTVLHDFLPRLVRDHEHLLAGKPTRLEVGTLETTFIAAPEAMVRIAVSNLLRNAIENTVVGQVEVTLEGGTICVADSGSGFDPAEAARRYRDSLRDAAPVRGQGLGMFLIGRICEHFGWRLSIAPGSGGGTRAQLDVSASVIVL